MRRSRAPFPLPRIPFSTTNGTLNTTHHHHHHRRRSSSFTAATSPSPSPKQRPGWNSNLYLVVTHPVLSLLELCDSMRHLKQIQAHLTRTGLMSHRFPASRVVAFCALSIDAGDMRHAERVFSYHVLDPNAYICNAMIRGYALRKRPQVAFAFFRGMSRRREDGMDTVVDARSFVFGLKACEGFAGVGEGMEVHCLSCKLGFGGDMLVRNALLHFYVAHGLLSVARELFDESPEKDVVSWTTMIDGYSQYGLAEESLKLFFSSMLLQSDGNDVKPNEVTLVAVLSSCSRIGDLRLGKSVHGYILMMTAQGILNPGTNLLNALVDMYAKCGCLKMAREIFDRMEAARDVFTWTSMINGYAKREDLEEARRLFDEMPERNAVSWSTMIAGYAQAKQPTDALELFQEMIAADVELVDAALLGALSACGQSGCLDLGERLHHQFICQTSRMSSIKLVNALMDMYAKCGHVDAAASLFYNMQEKDIVSWNTMILGYAVHGSPKEALVLFDKMTASANLAPDAITFVGILSACSHGGLVVEGCRHFADMRRIHGVEPNVEHYACMIDLLGRVGLLDEAHNLIMNMPMEPGRAGWGALLHGCRIHGNSKLGKLAGNKLLVLDPEDSGIYGLLSNLYATIDKREDVLVVRRQMRERGVKKTPGTSLIEVDGKFHKFFSADASHTLSKDVFRILDEIYMQVKWEKDYVPIT